MQQIEHIHWFLTNRCNLKCKYCFAPTFPEKCNESTNQIKHLAGIVGSMGVKQVTLTGGEPTLVKTLPEILAILHNSKIYTQLHTNATTLSAEKIAELKPFLGDLAIPIDSIDSEVQKELRGIDYLPKFFQVLEELENQKIKFNFHTVATMLNLDGFPRLYRALKNRNFGNWRVYEFNKTMVDNRFSGVERFLEVENLRKLGGSYTLRDYRRGCSDSLLAKFFLMEERMMAKKDRRLKFVACRDKTPPYIFLDNSGDIRYCTYFTRERVVVANLFKDGIEGTKAKVDDAVKKGPLFDEEGFIEFENDQPLWARLWLGNYFSEEIDGLSNPCDESEKGIDGRSWPKINHLYNLYVQREMRQDKKLVKRGYGILAP